MNIFSKVFLTICGFVLFVALPVTAQRGMGQSTGIANQGLQPDIETVTGILDHIKTGPCEHTTGHALIGTHLFLKNENSDQLINIHLGPADAVESYMNNLEIGQPIEARVFRTELLNPGNFIAKDVTSNGHTLQLRDENLRPFWAGQRNFRGSSRYGRGRGLRW